MKRTLRTSATVELLIYNECKYNGHVIEENIVEYNNVVAFEVTDGNGAHIEETDGSCIDDFNEYLIIYFEDGDTATFRNSYVDMFLKKYNN